MDKAFSRKLAQKENDQTDEKTAYVPTFHANNSNKETPKPRLVYDFAAKYNGVSINQCLLKRKDRILNLQGKYTNLE